MLTSEDEPGYSLDECACPTGEYIGARRSGTPDKCERCGCMTRAQFAAIKRAIEGDAEAIVARRVWDALTEAADELDALPTNQVNGLWGDDRVAALATDMECERITDWLRERASLVAGDGEGE